MSFPRFKGSNSGLLLWGETGSGKSQIMSYVTAWAHENNWMVMPVPECELYTWGSEKLKRHKNGLFIQEELAMDLIEDFAHSNAYNITQFKVNK